MQIVAKFNASNDVSISKRTFDKCCRRMGFSRGFCQETGITTASPNDQTGIGIFIIIQYIYRIYRIIYRRTFISRYFSLFTLVAKILQYLQVLLK